MDLEKPLTTTMKTQIFKLNSHFFILSNAEILMP